MKNKTIQGKTIFLTQSVAGIQLQNPDRITPLLLSICSLTGRH